MKFIEMKHIGFFIVLVSIVIFLFMIPLTLQLIKLNEILHRGCNLPEDVCPYSGFPSTSIAGFSIATAVLAFGLYILFMSRRMEMVNIENRKKFETVIKTLKGDEKRIYEAIIDSGAIFQGDIVEKLGLNKVKVSRILDKLEGRGLIERRRRGMSNVIVPKTIDSISK